jgi:hypothetical protein
MFAAALSDSSRDTLDDCIAGAQAINEKEAATTNDINATFTLFFISFSFFYFYCNNFS